MTAPVDSRRTRTTAYVLLGVTFLILILLGLGMYRSAHSDAVANEKADQLVTALGAAALPVPSKEQVARVLGDDGGAVCADPNSALKRAILYGELTNGAGGPGIRPVVADNRAVQGQLLIMKVYCPDSLAEFTAFLDDVKFADVAKE